MLYTKSWISPKPVFFASHGLCSKNVISFFNFLSKPTTTTMKSSFLQLIILHMLLWNVSARIEVMKNMRPVDGSYKFIIYLSELALDGCDSAIASNAFGANAYTVLEGSRNARPCQLLLQYSNFTMKSAQGISTTLFTPSYDQCSTTACEQTTDCCGYKQCVKKACVEDNKQIVGMRLKSSSSDPISKVKASGSECKKCTAGGKFYNEYSDGTCEVYEEVNIISIEPDGTSGMCEKSQGHQWCDCLASEMKIPAKWNDRDY